MTSPIRDSSAVLCLLLPLIVGAGPPPPKSCSIVVTVRDEEGAPLPNAHVISPHYVPNRRPATVVAVDSDGRAQVQSWCGGWATVLAMAPGYIGHGESLKDLVGGAEIVLTLKPGPRRVGQVTDQFGRPVPGVEGTVRVSGWTRPLDIDANGRFEVSRLGDRFERNAAFEFTAPGFSTSRHHLRSPRDPLERVRAVLVPARVVEGVVYFDDKPEEGVRVHVIHRGASNQANARTDAKGRFRFETLREGAYKLSATGAQGKLDDYEWQLGEGATPDLRVDLSPTAVVRVTVLDEFGRPPKQQFVTLGIRDFSHTTTRGVDANGVAEFQVLPGPVLIRVENDVYLSELRELVAEPRQTHDVKIVQRRVAAVRVQVIGLDGKPVEPGSITVKISGPPWRRFGKGLRPHRFTDEEAKVGLMGIAVFDNLQPGQVMASVNEPPGGVVFEAPTQGSVKLRLADATLSGRVVDRKKRPFPGVRVCGEYSPGKCPGQVITDAGGRFTLRYAAPGFYAPHFHVKGRGSVGVAPMPTGLHNVVVEFPF